ncbi:MAG: autotransporter outer membrane beta-barrel domain-containing protein [Akkermansia sp.]|nr:autotransporter outer membrane beta-barrel domain-containing protein [Akkermansia sp.]
MVATAEAAVLSSEATLSGDGYQVSSEVVNLDVVNSDVSGSTLKLKQDVVECEGSEILTVSQKKYLSSKHSESGYNDIIYAVGTEVEQGQVRVSTLVSQVEDSASRVLVRGNEGVVLELGNDTVLSGGEISLNERTVEVNNEVKFYRTVDVLKISAGEKATLKNTKAYIGCSLDMEGATLVLDEAEVELGNVEDKTTITAKFTVSNDYDENTYVIHVGEAAKEKIGLQKRPVVNGHIQGTGKLSNVKMQGGRLQIGRASDNRLGVLAIEQVEAGRNSTTGKAVEMNFTLSAADAAYDFSAANAVGAGKFTQLKLVGHANYGDMVTITIDYVDAAGATDKTALNGKFQRGASITLIDTTEGSISGTYVLDVDELPELEEGLMWYKDDLFRDGTLTVVDDVWYGLSGLSGDGLIAYDDVYDIIENNQVADSARLANTLLAAAGTTSRFGRAALSHVDDYRKWDSNVWGSAFFHNMNVSGSGRRTGFDSDTLGYAVGMDTRVQKYNAIVGVALGASYGDMKPDRGNYTYYAGKIEQDGVHFGLYGRICQLPQGYDEHSVNVDAFLSYGKYDCTSSRTAKGNGQRFRACWDETAWALGVTVSRNYRWCYGTVITPYVGLEYTMADMDGLREMGYTAVDYSCVDKYRNLELLVGARAHRSLRLRNGQVLIPYASTALGVDMLRQTPKVRAASKVGSFSESAADPGRVSLQLNAGSDWLINHRWSADAGYGIEFRSDELDQNLYISASRSF